VTCASNRARPFGRFGYGFVLLLAFGLGTGAPPRGVPDALAQSRDLKIGVSGSLTGPFSTYGIQVLDATRLAVDEVNAVGQGPHIVIETRDDHGNDDDARDVAGDFVAGDALVVIGPTLTTTAIAAGLTYAEGGLVSIAPTAHGDAVTDNETTFRSVVSTSEMGEALANYLRHVLGGMRAVVLYRDNGFGRPIAAGFRRAAERLGIASAEHGFTTAAELEAFAGGAAEDPEKPAVILGMVNDDAATALTALRRKGHQGPVLAPDAIAQDSFIGMFAGKPEYERDHAFFTEGVYAVSPMIIDSANAETLAFADRFRARYGRDPSWVETQGYDAARLAIAAVQTVAASPEGAKDLPTRRAAVAKYLASLDSPGRAIPGLTGPLWFTPDHGRDQPVRVGRFHGEIFESAPVQLVPIPNADAADIASGAVVNIGSGHFARRQRVVYTGVYLNEIPRVDVAQTRFTADLYLWLRFARFAGPGAADPTDIEFPDLVRGTSDGKVEVAQGELDDGTLYRLWRMRGDFKNDFDLHRYPADTQTLALRFFNTRAASDRVVYVQDRRSTGTGAITFGTKVAGSGTGTAQAGEVPRSGTDALELANTVAPDAFRNLTQWEPQRAAARRDNLVTASALGDPRLVGLERVRELSGFALLVDVHRRVVATLAKTLLPLGLMALIMFASLYFPAALVKEKVTVAITGALSGAVLLTSINSQLGSIGYIIAVEYGFYIFFGLCLLCIVSVLAAERLRAASRPATAVAVERTGRYLYLFVLAGSVLAAIVIASRW
jgi:ABC-type branched-subunit amino acid transport system substrate-binding protein